MLFFTVMVWPVLAALAAEDHTYRRTDPVTGLALTCDRCAPGFRLRAHCSRSRPTDCVPCEEGLFTEFWNYIPHCLLCDACASHQRVTRPCNGTANTVCECEPGFYWDQHFCRKHSQCGAGHRVKAAGTPHRDTVCELCADGWFADTSGAHAVCVRHSACSAGQHQLLPGSRWYDSVCATCDQLAEKGWAGLLEPVLHALHLQYRIPTLRLQHLVNRRLNKLRKRAAAQKMDCSSELLNLPMLREDSDLALLAGPISRRVQRVQQHCRNGNEL